MLILHSDVQVDESSKSEDKCSFAIVSDQPPATVTKEPSTNEAKDGSTDSEKPPEDPKESKKASRAVDPLRWFGILVPPALRSAQSSFAGAVEGSVPRLVTIARDLRSQEIEIGRVRKQIKKL